MGDSKVLNEGETPHDYRIKLESSEKELLGKFDIKKVLEVFSGDGRNFVYFSKLGFDVVGLESNSEFITESVKLIGKNKINAKVIKHPIFLDKFPFKKEEFDFIYSYQSLNHNFKEKIEGVFNEIYRVLRKGGLFSIKITDIEQINFKKLGNSIYEECDPEFPKIKYKKLAEQTFAKLEGDEKDIPHYGFFQSELVGSLEKVGFKLINIRKIKWNLVGNFTK